MTLSRLFKKNIVEMKQPQELYCSNNECVEVVASLGWSNDIFDDDGIELSQKYCINCLIDVLSNK